MKWLRKMGKWVMKWGRKSGKWVLVAYIAQAFVGASVGVYLAVTMDPAELMEVLSCDG